MKLVIPKNFRRPFPYFGIFLPVLIRKDKSFSIIKSFKFTESTIYYFDDNDQYDVNKLFGFSIGMHHNNSVRFGWRPNKDLSKIEIVGYEYHDKLRIPTLPICEISLNKWYEYQLKYNHKTNYIEYLVTDGENSFGTQHPIKIKKKFNFGYKLDLYFGGNKTAPHKMIIYRD
jgi:hypothetical protein